MKNQYYYADYVVNILTSILSKVYWTITLSWSLGLFYMIAHYWDVIPKEWFSRIDGCILTVFNDLNSGANWVMAYIFAPFYVHIILGIFVKIIEFIRKKLVFNTRFDSKTQVPLIQKKHYSGGSSESDWVNYYFIVRHPISEKPMRFQVSETDYNRVNKGDLVEIIYNPKHKNFLYLNVN